MKKNFKPENDSSFCWLCHQRHGAGNVCGSSGIGTSQVPTASARRAGSEIFSQFAWGEIARHLKLTGRELQIVRGVFDDRTEFAIAGDLGISPHTVHTHIERLRHKLDVVDRAALILRVVQEFLRLTAAPDLRMQPICGRHAAGLCQQFQAGG